MNWLSYINLRLKVMLPEITLATFIGRVHKTSIKCEHWEHKAGRDTPVSKAAGLTTVWVAGVSFSADRLQASPETNPVPFRWYRRSTSGVQTRLNLESRSRSGRTLSSTPPPPPYAFMARSLAALIHMVEFSPESKRHLQVSSVVYLFTGRALYADHSGRAV
jgi:hypothetical protein